MTSPLYSISVIIPTYKPKEYLWECLLSLKNQTLQKNKFEIIIALNGPREPWQSLIYEFAKANSLISNLTLLYTESAGVSQARNMALDIVRGEYITFIDDDDYVSPAYLEELYTKASQDTIALAYHYAFTDGFPEKQHNHPITDTYLKHYTKEKLKFTNARKYFSGPWVKMIHRKCICDRRFDKRFKNGEDSLFMFLISDKIKYVSFTSKNAIYYRRYRANSAVTRQRKKGDILSNFFLLILAYIQIYCKAPAKYNLSFFLSRLIGAVHGMIRAFAKF